MGGINLALLHVEFFSETLLMRTEMDVILPQKAVDKPFQVLYLLHGMSDDQTAWQRQTSIERYVEDCELAVIMPTTYLGWYTNMDRGERYFDFITQELPQVVRGLFPQLTTDRADTFVAGLSMGGYGALKCGLCAPQLFSHAAPLSGALDVAALVERLTAMGVPEGEQQLFRDIFGDFAQVRGSQNDLLHRAELLAPQDRPRLFIWCGTEDFLYQDNLTMRDRLNELGYDLTYTESAGDHRWLYWDREIQNVLSWLPLRKGGEL